LIPNNDREIPEIEDYVGRLKKKLRFMSGKNKENILGEVRSHLYESALDQGGLARENVLRAVSDYGDPKIIAKRYKVLYGYSKALSVIFIIMGFFLGILTVPVSVPALKQELAVMNTLCLVGNTALVILLFVVIIFSGVKFGRWTGLFVGLAAFASRGLTVVVITEALSNINDKLEVMTSEGPCFLMIFVSLMMPIAGFIAGRVFIKFKKKDEGVEWE